MKTRAFPSSSGEIFLAGAAHLDRHARSHGAVLAAASNPGSTVEATGGAIGNAALALASLGLPATLKSGRGGDAGGERVAASLAGPALCDLSTTWLDRASPSYTAILDGDGDLVAGIADMALYDLLTPRIFRSVNVRAAMARSAAFLIDANLPAATMDALAQAAAGRPIGAIGVSPAKVVRVRPCLHKITALFVSRAEAAVLCDVAPQASVVDLACRLRMLGARHAVVTDGPHPAALLAEEEVLLQAPPRVDVRSVIGAGDTLAVVTVAMLAAQQSFVEAARMGIAAAAVRISRDGFPKSVLQKGDFASRIMDMYETLAIPIEQTRLK